MLEYVQGDDLRHRLAARAFAREMIPIRGACWIAREIGHALVHAHQLGIVHRDLKPANVLVNHPHQRPLVKVLDFGAARTLGAEEHEVTTRGRQVGSLMYMAPEQVGAREITTRTDVFALGVILFELLTLRRCWAVDNSGERLRFDQEPSDNRIDVQVRIERGERPTASAHRSEVPPALDELIGRALAPHPGDRHPSVQRFLEAMRLAPIDEPSAEDISVITEPAPTDVARAALRRAETAPVESSQDITDGDLP
jgi:serine/threonine-protein kinase